MTALISASIYRPLLTLISIYMEEQTEKTLRAIIEKGGLYGSIAKQYLFDEKMAEQFIRECGEQTHNKSTQKFWGKKLVKEINQHCKRVGHENSFRNKKIVIPEDFIPSLSTNDI